MAKPRTPRRRQPRRAAPSWKNLLWPVTALVAVTAGLVWLLARQPEPIAPAFESGLTAQRPRTPVRPAAAPPAAKPSEPAGRPPPAPIAKRRELSPAAAGPWRIAIVIDDVGIDRRGAETAIRLPPGVTLSFLPYAGGVTALAMRAEAAGHELLVHLPMEPEGSRISPGPNALLTGLEPDEIRRRLDWNLSRFDGYIGVNNHMGSKFTADAAAMKIVIDVLKQRGLMFLDSRTTAQTQGAKLAAAEGEPFAERDVFLDNDQSSGNVRARLAEVETLARKQGRAVAIGHPHAATLATLAQWLPTLEARGYRLVPVSQLMSADNKPR